MEKVITIATIPAVKDGTNFTEITFPELDKLLSQGYSIRNVHQISPNPEVFGAILTFILVK